jgi:hypothetical protein
MSPHGRTLTPLLTLVALVVLMAASTAEANARPPQAPGPTVRVSYRLDRMGVRSSIRRGLSGVLDATALASPRVHIDEDAGRLLASFPDARPSLAPIELGRTRLHELRSVLRREARGRAPSSDLVELLAMTEQLVGGQRSGLLPPSSFRRFRPGPIRSMRAGQIIGHGAVDGFRLRGVLGAEPIELEIVSEGRPDHWTARVRRWNAFEDGHGLSPAEARPLALDERRALRQVLQTAGRVQGYDGTRYHILSELLGPPPAEPAAQSQPPAPGSP